MMPDQPAAPDAIGPRGLPHCAAILYSPREHLCEPTHERLTHVEIAKRLAVLKGLDFVGEYDASRLYSGPAYFVPTDTLVGIEATQSLGIRCEHDLFGGVVPYPFVATKAITHPLVEPNAYAPVGWSREFGDLVRDAVHLGFTAFTLDDARRGCARLLDRGPVRIKPVRATAGRGQVVISGASGLEAALSGMDAVELSRYGLVIEENLADVTTYSVGQVRVAELVATYYGTQCVTRDNTGAAVYGGSALAVVRGGFGKLLALPIPPEARVAVAQAQRYDAAAKHCFPGMLASRCNYDVAQGLDSEGRRRSGVLEQSWRIGGASGAELAALEAFRAQPSLHVVHASCKEIYGECEAPPSHATVYFRGIDEQIGPITKCALVEAYDHPQ